MEIKNKKVDLFMAGDGKQFLNEQDCTKYEREIMARMNSMKYYVINYQPDLTEGRAYYKKIYAACELGWMSDILMELFCETIFTSRIDWVMGVSPIHKYNIYDSNRQTYENVKTDDSMLKIHITTDKPLLNENGIEYGVMAPYDNKGHTFLISDKLKKEI